MGGRELPGSQKPWTWWAPRSRRRNQVATATAARVLTFLVCYAVFPLLEAMKTHRCVTRPGRQTPLGSYELVEGGDEGRRGSGKERAGGGRRKRRGEITGGGRKYCAIWSTLDRAWNRMDRQSHPGLDWFPSPD
ncbi:hypothetical protein BV20DRAFT_961746 [Pilatotrama ljubarskyi]|nr:hypothetical protein BV20DRAFT_961746 [Pilatotrama ljubarskyi]